MALQLNKTAIRFDEMRVFRLVVPGQPDQLWVNVGYIVDTAEAEPIRKMYERELTGGSRTRVVNMFSDLVSLIKAEEGIP